jgi:hypothetical protein
VSIFSSCKQFSQIVDYATVVIPVTMSRNWKMTSCHQIWKLIERILLLVASCLILPRLWTSYCNYLDFSFLICNMRGLPCISCHVLWSPDRMPDNSLGVGTWCLSAPHPLFNQPWATYINFIHSVSLIDWIIGQKIIVLFLLPLGAGHTLLSYWLWTWHMTSLDQWNVRGCE